MEDATKAPLGFLAVGVRHLEAGGEMSGGTEESGLGGLDVVCYGMLIAVSSQSEGTIHAKVLMIAN